MSTGKTAKARATRRRLLDAATKMFAERGYEHTSMRGLGDELGLTSGVVYVHFRNKADLLAATVAEAIADQVDRPPESGGATYLEGAASLFARHEGQATLRALLLAAAEAAKSDDAVRERLRAVQLERIDAWAAVAQRDQAAGRLGDGVDVETLVRLLWALEFGLVVFDVFGMEPPDAKQTGLAVERFLT
jgi:AcrR family transcriptional regulator